MKYMAFETTDVNGYTIDPMERLVCYGDDLEQIKDDVQDTWDASWHSQGKHMVTVYDVSGTDPVIVYVSVAIFNGRYELSHIVTGKTETDALYNLPINSSYRPKEPALIV